MTSETPEMEKRLQAALNKVAELEQQVNVLENGKTESEIFWNNKNGEYMKWKSLSETKKYFEVNHLGFLKTLGTKMSSKQFHEAIVSKLGL